LGDVKRLCGFAGFNVRSERILSGGEKIERRKVFERSHAREMALGKNGIFRSFSYFSENR
jgi:hypothetical protein